VKQAHALQQDWFPAIRGCVAVKCAVAGALASDPRAILSKRMWSAQRAVTEASSDALLSFAQHKFTLPSSASPAAARLLGTSPQLAELLTSPEADSPSQQGQLESSTHDKVGYEKIL
jgi:hypothetical protein